MRKLSFCLFAFFVLFSKAQIGYKQIHNLKRGYSFKVNTSYWLLASEAKRQRKIEQDQKLTGKGITYDYVFTVDTLKDVTIPFFVVQAMTTKEGDNFEFMKKDFNKTVGTFIDKNGDAFHKLADEINFNENTTIIDEKNKRITLVINIKRADGINATNLSVWFFKDKHVVQFIFSQQSANFVGSFKFFEEVINSVKFSQ